MPEIQGANILQSYYQGVDFNRLRDIQVLSQQVERSELQSKLAAQQQHVQETQQLRALYADQTFRDQATEKKMSRVRDILMEHGDIDAATKISDKLETWEKKRTDEAKEQQQMIEKAQTDTANEAYRVAEEGDDSSLQQLKQDIVDKYKTVPNGEALAQRELARLPKQLNDNGRKMLRQYAASHESISAQNRADKMAFDIADRAQRTRLAQQKLELERTKEKRIEEHQKVMGSFAKRGIQEPTSETIARQGREYATALSKDPAFKDVGLPADERRRAADFISHRINELRIKGLDFNKAQLGAQAEARAATKIGDDGAAYFDPEMVKEESVPEAPEKPAEPKPSNTPPAETLQEGKVTVYANGQEWMLQSGKPVRVK